MSYCWGGRGDASPHSLGKKPLQNTQGRKQRIAGTEENFKQKETREHLKWIHRNYQRKQAGSTRGSAAKEMWRERREKKKKRWMY